MSNHVCHWRIVAAIVCLVRPDTLRCLHSTKRGGRGHDDVITSQL